MMRNPRNPFQYGGTVGPPAFCNRRKELADLLRTMEDGGRLFVYSERRLGKTSLLQLALSRLPGKAFLSAYVDLWPTDGEASFAAAMAKALTEGMATTADRMLGFAKEFFGRLVPTITADDDGSPKVAFELSSRGSRGVEIDEVLAAPHEIARRRRCSVVIVFDEFQRILEYSDDIVERKLRSAIQRHKNVSYIFSGSRKHLIQRMFLDKSRPLYRAGGHYPLGPIAFKDWLPFIRKRFLDSNREIEEGHIRSICDLTEGHPFYTQHLCHAVWELCEKGDEVGDSTIEAAVQLLLDRESYAYTALWESLAVNQRKLLRGLAAASGSSKVFSADFLHAWGLGSASNAQRVVETLLDRD
ncbi:MAG: ATP-binding protein, partial [bacterium]